ncbi:MULTISPECIES: universal stress protein [Ferroplasma]|jgi:nucleotide-binding universal stress UspA family protein|uniref:Universal stress protein n=2 Tax=Ferroplasma TaxID=74968 RepID=S0AQY4_FERAC|nr:MULTISPECIES: universal stress protein [Ferroplasma]MCL4349018.1 universal stress protein [Candidatus Thermoplasmatota archaeon]AGO60500.1 universal stress protein [Ferroplasma acidarmanus Fer1]ARD85301.1 universal stress protein [Ferroplasma acidiphilum]NOL59478.1 universal stress protein [Ferroplasma acidiphilum]WMT52407.1 MAG: universal stress protein [Ferroplasma acidiphilum]
MKVLVSYDGSEGAREALKYALELKCTVDEYYIVYVIPTIVGISASFDSYIPQSVYEGQDKTADQILEKAKKVLDKEEAKYELIKISSNGEEIPKIILKTAEEKGINLIVTGTRKLHGFSKLILGSVSSGIIAHSNIPVTVVPPKE